MNVSLYQPLMYYNRPQYLVSGPAHRDRSYYNLESSESRETLSGAAKAPFRGSMCRDQREAR